MIVITRKDGGVSIMALTVEAKSADAEIEKWKLRHPDEYLSHREMPDSAYPEDKTFRNAWRDVTPEPVIDIDIDRAREIHKDKLRELRAPKLAALDIEMNRAVLKELFNGTGKATQVYDLFEARKQALRDVTADPSISAAKTPDELKAVVPAALT